jgi:hypothetical protein
MIAAIIYGLLAMGTVLAVFLEMCKYIAYDDRIGVVLMAICTIIGLVVLGDLVKEARMFLF